jgi:hypothetical protein
VTQPGGKTLVPPRPNLGPEPWPGSSSLETVWLFLGIAILAVAAWLLSRIVLRRLRRSRHGAAPPEPHDGSPRGRLVALSTSAKSSLASRFGPAWRAKTTQELATESALRELLGPEKLAELIEFLDRIDRLKFAPERPSQNGLTLEGELVAWNPRVTGLIARIEARAKRPFPLTPSARPS